MKPVLVIKSSVQQQYLDYLEDMMYNTHPGFHSMRVQPAKYSIPAEARELTTPENVNFKESLANDGRDTRLPLSITELGHTEPLRGRHVYPFSAFSMQPNLMNAGVDADLPRSYKIGRQNKIPDLQMYGFEGKENTPQRYANNAQTEGIIYGDVDESQITPIMAKPYKYHDMRHVANSLLPTSGYTPADLPQKRQKMARELMDMGVPPLLMDEHMRPQNISDPYEVDSMRDDTRQWNQNQQRLNIPTEDLLYASEPMDIAMRLLKMPQEAKDYANQIHEGQMYGEQPYMNHVEDVASGFDDPHLQRIAYLHDTIEDSETGIGEIHERFGEDVGHAVDALTRRQGEQYFDYINRVKEHPEATQVKLADLHSNLKNNPNESLARRYQKAIGILTNKSEPMDIAMRLLKQRDRIYDPLNEGIGEEGVDFHPGDEGVDWDSAVSSSLYPGHDLEQRHPNDPDMQEYDRHAQELLGLMVNRDIAHLQGNEKPMTENEQFDLMDARQKLQASIPKNTHFSSIQNAVGYDKDGNKTSTFGDGRPKFNEGSPRYQELIGDRPTVPIHTEGSFYGVPFNEETGFTRSEPMDIAMRLLKERVSPEAKRHKLEYDKKYESSPERVKYREDLNRERRRRGIYGSHDHKDISHTQGGKLTLEGEHENRARHFKDKGTLREL